MKKNFFLSLITLSAITSLISLSTAQIAYSQSESVVEEANCVGEPQAYISPENLAMMAYQGYLEKQGIPGYQVFEQEFQEGNLTGEKIVQAAVTGCLLSDKYGVPSHSNYIQEVQNQVQLLIQENQRR